MHDTRLSDRGTPAHGVNVNESNMHGTHLFHYLMLCRLSCGFRHALPRAFTQTVTTTHIAYHVSRARAHRLIALRINIGRRLLALLRRRSFVPATTSLRHQSSSALKPKPLDNMTDIQITQACCNTPKTEVAAYTDKGIFKPLSKTVHGLERRAYRVGPSTSKLGVVAIIDIHGFHATTTQFFDVLFRRSSRLLPWPVSTKY